MSACSLALELLAAALLAPLGLQDEAAARVGEEFAAGRFREALEASAGIEDAALRAQWRFHVRYVAGDLPGALLEAEAGLRAAPDDSALALNAAQAAIELGDPLRAGAACGRLADLEARGGAQGHAERIRGLRARAEELRIAALAARRATSLAHGSALAALGLAALAIAALAFWPHRRRAT